MDLPKLNLPNVVLKTKLVEATTQVFDVVRKKYFKLTAEEWVRQHFIHYLNKDKKFEIYFIMGADNLINFHKWYKWKSIIKKCNLLVFDRQGYKAKSLRSVTYNGVNKNRLSFINFKKVNISSSQLRKI